VSAPQILADLVNVASARLGIGAGVSERRPGPASDVRKRFSGHVFWGSIQVELFDRGVGGVGASTFALAPGEPPQLPALGVANWVHATH
jgi:hypothetical protein